VRKTSLYRWFLLVILLASSRVPAQQEVPTLIEAGFGSAGGEVTAGEVRIVGHLGSTYTTPVLTLDDLQVLPGLYGSPAVSIVGDFDQDGMTGFSDFLIFASVFGLNAGDAGFRSDADLDGSGDIGFGDFLVFAAAFGSQA